jgi:hypothetical protein
VGDAAHGDSGGDGGGYGDSSGDTVGPILMVATPALATKAKPVSNKKTAGQYANLLLTNPGLLETYRDPARKKTMRYM